MIVYDHKVKKLVEIYPQDYTLGRHLKASDMTQKQRELVIGQYIKLSPEVVDYLQNHTTNRVNAVNQARKQMVKGELPLNIVVLMVLIEDAIWEQKWRVH